MKMSTCRLSCFSLFLFLMSGSVLAAPNINYKVVSEIDTPPLFVQGLEYENNTLYVGTGLEGNSALYSFSYPDMTELDRRRLNKDVFGEGLAIFGSLIYQLTLDSQQVIISRKSDLSFVKGVDLKLGNRQGWGLSKVGNNFALTQGTDEIFITRGKDFTAKKQKIKVKNNGQPLWSLNEIERVNGLILANEFLSNTIWIIDPKNGTAIGKLNLKDIANKVPTAKKTYLGNPVPPGNDVLNSIAWDNDRNELIVWGKLWKKMYVLDVPMLYKK